jgi:ABC-2 type transport system permease protein
VVLGDAAFLVGDAVASVGVREAFRDLASGVVSAFSIVYFLGLAALGLAANLYFIRGRRMRTGAWHLPARLACLVVSAVALGVLAERSGARADVTAERLHSLAPLTRETLKAIPADKPVFIQAYVSAQVPREYVEMRANLLGILREIDALGGGKVHVRVTEATRASDAAREADERYGIKAVPMSGGEGRMAQLDVFLGVAVTSGLDEVVVPFFHHGLAPEYEVTRSIRAVMNSKRARVGIAATDANWLGGYNFQARQQMPPWEIVEELKRQYEVVNVPLDAPITEGLDVLVVPMPSSLKQPQLDAVMGYVKQGKPTLLLDDPVPWVNLRMGPNENDRAMASAMGQRPPEPKGDARAFYRDLGLHWNFSDIVWDRYAPHPWIRVEPEVVFTGPGNGSPEPFSRTSPVTARLQEIVFIFGGSFEPAKAPGIEVTPLVRAGNGGGVVSYTNVMHPFLGLNPGRRHFPTALPDGPIMAARMLGKAGDISVDAIAIADIDFISGQFFALRRDRDWQKIKFDNIPFFLSAVDALARDEAMIGLRTRRPRHRTLETVEKATRDYEKSQLEAANAAERNAETELAEAQSRFDKAVGEIAARTDVDQQTKEIMAASIREAELKKLEAAKRRIEDGKAAAVAKSEDDRDRRVEGIRNDIRLMALLMTPLPAIVIGLFVLGLRIRRELEARR